MSDSQNSPGSGRVCACGATVGTDAPGALCTRCFAESLLLDLDDSNAREDRVPSENIDGEWAGRYRMIDVIGEGGFGTVYRAEQLTPFRREVAVKILKPGMDSKQILARFGAEQQALALLDHQNITKVFDAGKTDNERPYFAMELVNGIAIDQYCIRNRLPIDARLSLFVEACSGVAHAHARSIIHRDLKPSNVLITDQEERPVPKIIDFGLARATEYVLTNATLVTGERQIMGTPEYMSPEQVVGSSNDLDARTDVYSLGVILYQLITGTLPLPLRNLSITEAIRIVSERDPVPPSSQGTGTNHSTRSDRSKIKSELDWIVLKAIAKEPGRRYQSVNAFQKDVQSYLNDEAISARPPSKIYKLRKLAAKHRLVTTVAIFILLLTAIFLVVDLRFAMQAREGQAQQNLEARFAASLTDLELAAAQLRTGNGPECIAYLVRSLRKDPKNTTAAQLLLNTLPHFAWSPHAMAPSSPRLLTFDSEGPVGIFAFADADGYIFSLAKDYRSGQMWDSVTGEPTSDRMDFENALVVDRSEDPAIVAFAYPIGAGGLYLFVNPITHEEFGAKIFSIQRQTCSKMTRDASLFITGRADGSIVCWNVQSGAEKFSLNGHASDVTMLALSTDGSRGVSASADGTARIFDIERAEFVGKKAMHDERISWIAISPTQECFATGSIDGSARIWSMEDGHPITPVLRHRGNAPVTGVFGTFSGDGQFLVTGGASDFNARIWDTETGDVANEPLPHPASVLRLDVDATGRRITTACADGKVRVWDIATGIEVMPPLDHGRPVEFAYFNLPATRLASCDETGVGKIVELAPIDPEIPMWFLDLSELLVCRKFNDRDVMIELEFPSVAQLQAIIPESNPNNPATAWANWFIEDPHHRDPSPFFDRNTHDARKRD